MSQGGDNLALDRDAVVIDLLVEWLAERDGVFRDVAARPELIGVMEPKSKAVKKVKTRPVGDAVSSWLIVRAKEDGGREDALESLYDPAVMAAVFREAEEVQHSSRAVEVDSPALLLDRERCDPDGNQPVLAEGQTELGVPGDFKEELSVAASVGQLTFGRRAKWKPAEDERSGVVGEFLAAVRARLADQANAFELLEPELGEANGGQDGLKGSAEKSGSGWGSSVGPTTVTYVTVRKLCQKCIDMKGKGVHFERKQMAPN